MSINLPFQLIYKVDAENKEKLMAFVAQVQKANGMKPKYVQHDDPEFQVVYKVTTEGIDELLYLVFEIQRITNIDPNFIRLRNGHLLKYNQYAAHQYAAEGRISMQEFIEMCK